MSVLERIVARTRVDLAARMARCPRASLEARLTPSTRDFRAALAGPTLSLLAEFKPASPSRGPLRPDADPARYARAYARAAAAISVLTDEPFFGGGLHLLDGFRQACDRPLLRKDFVVDGYQLVEARVHGADAVLLIAALHDEASLRSLVAETHALGMEALVEAHDAAEIDRSLAAGARVIGVNARDLRTLCVDPEAALPLLDRLPPGVVRVAESGLEERAQIARLVGHADAVLIGSALMLAPTPEEGLERLGW